MGPKVILSDEEFNYLVYCFESVARRKGRKTVDVPKMFKEKYANLNVSYPKLKSLYDEKNKLIPAQSIKRDLSDLSKEMLLCESKLIRSMSSLSMDLDKGNALNSDIELINETDQENTNIQIIYTNHALMTLLLLHTQEITFLENIIFQRFLHLYDLKVVAVPGDGFCFLNCIRLFLNEFIRIDLNIEYFAQITHEYFMENRLNEYNDQIDYETYLNNCINSYFIEGHYDTNFVDYFINEAANIFKFNLCIIQDRNYSTLVTVLRPNETEINFSTNLIIMHRQQLHYNLIVPLNHQMDHSDKERKNLTDHQIFSIIRNEFSQSNDKICQKEIIQVSKSRITRKRKETGLFRIAINCQFKDDLVAPHHLSDLNKVCKYCQALHFEEEKSVDGSFSMCCHKGKVSLLNKNPFPEEIMNLMNGSHRDSKDFMDNIRKYNSALAFASMICKINEPNGRGPYCFKIHDQVYHQVSSIHPENSDDKPKYCQLYILDSETALKERLANPSNKNCNPQILKLLDELLRKINPYYHAFRQMRDVEIEQEKIAKLNGFKIPEIRMFLKKTIGQDKRRYNLPKSGELAVVFVSDNGEPPVDRDLVIYSKAKGRTLINSLSCNCDPMVYPLLFPFGEPGWRPGIDHVAEKATKKRNKITMLQFYAFQLSVREGFNQILMAGKLLQQYCVDAYVKVESNNLNWIRSNQKELRVEMYQGLMDYINSVDDEIRPGKVVVLPSSFIGSPRAMQQNYQNAMAICCKYGKPDLFITFTCNPKWKEIKNNLTNGERAENRPDLTSRVFQLKLKELIKDITDHQIFGHVIAYCISIEFQKRGLPHAHILVILSSECKIRDRAEIDQIISAEIPDKTVNPILFKIVTETMVHGPCGKGLDNQSVCMENGKCTKEFPKPFQRETIENNGGYPRYMRRDNEVFIEKNNVKLDNRWIVPYNPYLTVKFQAHINVELCSTISSIKYIYKYIYKGYDCGGVQVENNNNNKRYDEINNYLNVRYVSSNEAIWRLFEFKMYYMSHTVYRLAIHLPFNQPVYFKPGDEENAIRRASESDTTLTAWFKLNSSDNNASKYYYKEIPNYYTFTKKEWKLRERSADSVIGRIYHVSPKEIERFCLRLLLLHVKGAQTRCIARILMRMIAPTAPNF